MSLSSTLLIPFLAIVWGMYYLVPGKYQWMVLSLASAVYLVWAGGFGSLLFLLFTAGTVYAYALLLEKMQKQQKTESKNCNSREEKKAVKAKWTRLQNVGMTIVIGLNIAVWYGFKLGDRMWTSAEQSGSFWMPLAMSFYVFIAIGYLVDVYRKTIPAEKSFLHLVGFLSYFPQMTEGPFSRYQDVAPQMFAEHKFSWERLQSGVLRILWGYSKKLIVADALWNSLHVILNDGYDIYAPSVAVTLFLLPLQQYMDFSGCMDIVLGISHVCGIDLKENFKAPEFSKSIAEVWRRWHITLCEWFKDYVFYPVATAKLTLTIQKKIKKLSQGVAKRFPAIIAMFVVWTITGLWHGPTLNNVLWGWMNFAILATSFVLEDWYKQFHAKTHIAAESSGWKTFSIIRTICLFGVMEVMADVSSTSQALRMYIALVTPSQWRVQEGVQLLPEMTLLQLVPIILYGGIVIWHDVKMERGAKKYGVLDHMPRVAKIAIFVILYYGLILFSFAGSGGTGFAYAKF